jgi:hypothetical protein
MDLLKYKNSKRAKLHEAEVTANYTDPICRGGEPPLRFGQREFSRDQDCHRTPLV